jgi:5-(carboxyamino)imidazole ribonucleotide mutase
MTNSPLVGIIVGSKSDLDQIASAGEMLETFGIPYEKKVISAHRTPDLLIEYASKAESRGMQVLIAGAGAAAALPGMLAALTLVPVLGVPLSATALNGVDALYSIVQMPAGVPVGTLAIGKSGAANAGILAAEIIGVSQPEVRERIRAWRTARAAAAREQQDP